MQPAAFSITRYLFDQVSVDLENLSSNDIHLSFDTSGTFNSKENSYQLVFTITAFNDENNKNKYFVKVRCKGDFVFENVNSFEEIPSFFYRNSIAILFPYVRAFVSILTTQANLPGIIIPTFNLSSLEEGLRKNTSVIE